MANINLNNYVQITAEELVNFLLNSRGYISYQEINDDYLDNNLVDWIESYLLVYNREYGDLEWESGISDLNTELGDYLYDKLHKEDLND